MEKKIINTYISIYSFDELPIEYKQLINQAKEQTKKAYAPYSNFKVGSAVLLENDIIVGGNNQENMAYPSGLCAERVGVFSANSQYPNTPILAIAVAAYTNDDFTESPINPCGSCLQVLIESEKRFGKKIKVILYGKKEIHVINSIEECLPLNFKL